MFCTLKTKWTISTWQISEPQTPLKRFNNSNRRKDSVISKSSIPKNNRLPLLLYWKTNRIVKKSCSVAQAAAETTAAAPCCFRKKPILHREEGTCPFLPLFHTFRNLSRFSSNLITEMSPPLILNLWIQTLCWHRKYPEKPTICAKSKMISSPLPEELTLPAKLNLPPLLRCKRKIFPSMKEILMNKEIKAITIT